MAESKNLKTAVDAEVKSAEKDVKTGNVTTAKAPPIDHPTGHRRGLPSS